VSAPEACDLLIVGGDVVTMNPAREVLVGGAVAVADDRIVAVGSTSDLTARFPDAPRLDARDCVVTPGIVNVHQHFTGDPLVRSAFPDTLYSGDAVFNWSVPLHAQHTGDDDEISALLTATESLLRGVTTIIEAGTVAHPMRVAAGLRATGARGAVGCWGWDTPGVPFAASADEVLDRQREVVDAFAPDERVIGWVTLVGHSLATPELLTGASELARERGVGFTMHLSPSASDPEVYLERHGQRPAVYLEEIGALGRHVILAHCVYFDDDEFAAMQRTETAIGYCPAAYLRTGGGVFAHGRHAQFFLDGGRIGLGCDAINAGDTVDVLHVASLAASIAKEQRIDPGWFGGIEVLEMATIRGAEAIGMDAAIGSLEVGKKADIVVHDGTAPEWTPRGDIAMQLIWSAHGRTVRDVLVDGEVVVRDGTLLTVDMQQLRLDAAEAATALWKRTGLEIPHAWPYIDAR